MRKVFKRTLTSSKFDSFLEKYSISKEYLFINRKMVTRALFIGVFIGVIPMPFQMFLVLGMYFFYEI